MRGWVQSYKIYLPIINLGQFSVAEETLNLSNQVSETKQRTTLRSSEREIQASEFEKSSKC